MLGESLQGVGCDIMAFQMTEPIDWSKVLAKINGQVQCIEACRLLTERERKRDLDRASEIRHEKSEPAKDT